MGFRHHLYLVNKENLKDLKTFLNTLENNEDDTLCFLDITDYLKCTYLLELGKYSEEGSKLCQEPQSALREYSKAL